MEGLKKASSIYASPRDKAVAGQREWSSTHPVLSGLASFFTGGATDPDAEMGPADVAMAAMPFAAVGKMHGLQQIAGKSAVFHGTDHAFDLFSHHANDPHDTLGWMTHAAEIPANAEKYVNQGSGTWSGNTGTGRIIPVTSSSQNVLDIATDVPVGEDWEAVKQALLGINGRHPNMPLGFNKDAANDVVSGYQTALNGLSKARGSSMNKWMREHTSKTLGQLEQDPAKFEAIKKMYISGHPNLSNWLKDVRKPFNDPSAMEKSGFDAIRYLDAWDSSWAFPKPEQLSTPWGTPLGKAK